MKSACVVIAGLMLVCSPLVLAQATQPQGSEQQATAGEENKLILNKASEVIGKDVVNAKDEKLGHIKELTVDAKTGEVAYAVLEYDKLATARDKLFAVPWQALNPKTDTNRWFSRKVFVLDVPKEKLDSAPGFDRNHWPDMANREWATQIHEFYGQKPYWQQQRKHRAHERMRDQTEANREQQQGAQAENQNTTERQILKVDDQLMKKDIMDRNDKSIASVKDLMIDRPTGKIAVVIVSLAELRDNSYAALPWQAISWHWNAEKKKGTLALNVSPDELRTHSFSASKWPDFSNRTELTDLYRSYNARPFWEERPSDVMGFQE